VPCADDSGGEVVWTRPDHLQIAAARAECPADGRCCWLPPQNRTPATAQLTAAEAQAMRANVECGSKIALVVTTSDSRCTTQMVEPNPDHFEQSHPRSAIQ
jgi:hypothetical protein